jgi:hypothetical protein
VSTEQQDKIVADAQCQWVAALPDSEVPEVGDFFRWLIKAGSADVLLRSIARVGKKFRTEARAGTEMSSDDACRYLTSTIIREASGKPTFPPSVNKVGIRRLRP